jgi:hypothetical protein
MSGGSLLVLDQSLSSTGFALWDGSDVVSGIWPLCDGIESRAQGFRELFHRLDALHKGRGLAQIVHEEPVMGAVNKGAGQIIAAVGLVPIIELFAISRGLPSPISYAPQSWRASFFTKAERKAIRGKDWKRPAVERARQLGFDPVSADEAEAIAILDHHLLKLKITPHWRQGAAMLDPVA